MSGTCEMMVSNRERCCRGDIDIVARLSGGGVMHDDGGARVVKVVLCIIVVLATVRNSGIPTHS